SDLAQRRADLADAALDARPVEDELADAVHELVEARWVDAEDDALVLAAPAWRRLAEGFFADRDRARRHRRRTLDAAAERVEVGAEHRGAGGGLGAIADRHQRAHPIEGGVESIEGRLAAERPGAEEHEDALQRVRGLGHRRQANHRGGALERVRLAEELV